MTIPIEAYAARRSQLAQTIGDGIAIVAAAPERPRSRDSHHPYRFDSYFYYLTGFTEPEAVFSVAPGLDRIRPPQPSHVNASTSHTRLSSVAQSHRVSAARFAAVIPAAPALASTAAFRAGCAPARNPKLPGSARRPRCTRT